MSAQPSLLEGLRPPPGRDVAPPFAGGWGVDGGVRAPYLAYLDDAAAGWSAELEALHAASSLEHPIDVLTRRAAVAALRGAGLGPAPRLLDVGCSTGHLLVDLRAAFPAAELAGVDAEAAGLPSAHAAVPDAPLMYASATDLPFADGVIDGLVALNLLEHLADDGAALAEFARVLRPGGRAVVVVPSNPALYDYYDAHLLHERRYAEGELASKARAAGLRALRRIGLGSVVYPGFWLVKKRNRRMTLTDEQARLRVEGDISRSQSSPVARAAFALEGALLTHGRRPRRGIREAIVLERAL
jgi:ubiquinone/menaquinone biosynthesis C-methylase UbiE